MNATAFASRCVSSSVLFAVIVLALACDSSTTPPDIPDVPDPITVVVAPSNATVQVGATQAFTAQVLGGDAATVRTVQWSLQPATGIASLQVAGNTVTATGVAPGTVSVIATGPGAATAAAALRVDPVPIVADTVEVTPPAANLTVGATIQLSAVVKDDAGNVLDDQPVVWTPQDANVATVTAGGLVTGVAPGTTQIRATSGEAAGASTVTVIAALPAGRMAYALADDPDAPTYTAPAATSLNSNGQPITITRLGTGQYQVAFGGQAPAAGQTQYVHVSSYGRDHNWCKIATAGPQGEDLQVSVNCYSPVEAPTDDAFVILLLGDDALPGRFAFGWADQPTTPFAYTPAWMHTSGSQPLVVHRDESGIYRVNFPGLARAPGGRPETTLVGAISGDPSRCAVNGIASTSVLPVHCFGPIAAGPTTTDVPYMFALLEQGQPGRRFAFTTSSGLGGVPPEETFSSSGGEVTTVRHGAGRIDVTFAGLGRNGATGSETVHVVASTNLDSYCKVLNWDASGVDLLARVECYDVTGLPADSDFRILVMQ